MNWSVPYLFLLGVLPIVVALSPYFELDHQFSETVGPCEDFREFVCNPKENDWDSYVFRTEYDFYGKFRSLLGNYSDPIIDFMREVERRNLKLQKQLNEGVKYGMESASGHPRFTITTNVANETFQIADSHAVGVGKEFKSVECVYANCPAFVKGIVSGFKELTDMDNLIDLKKWKIVARFVDFVVELPTPKPGAKQTAIRDKYTSYMNLLLVKVAAENSLWPSKELQDELDNVGAVAVEEIIAQIKRQTWIPSDRKAEIVKFMKAAESRLTPTEATRDLGNIKTAIDYFVTHFEQRKGDLMAQMDNESCDAACLTGLTAGVIREAMIKYNAKFQGTSGFVDFTTVANNQTKWWTYNGFSGLNKVLLMPRIMFHLKNDHPLGLLWSKLLQMVGHEWFHTFDPNPSPAHIRKPVEDLRGLREYEDAVNCYAEYYGSHGVAAPNGTIVYPNGKWTYAEGFSDVEGTRIIMKVLERTLFTKRAAFKSSYSRSKYNDLQWFFIGGMIDLCEKSTDDWRITDDWKIAMTPLIHPRNAIRANAWVRQLDEFSRVFGCKPGDPMYVVEKQCKAFPE